MNKIYSLLMFVGLLSFWGCKKAEGPDMNYYVSKPSNLTLDLHKTILTANWEYNTDDRIAGFRVDVASDQGFTNIIQTDTLAVDQRSFTFDDLGYFSAAYVRVRTLAKDIILNSEFATANVLPESVFITPDKADIAVSHALLKWNAPSSGNVTDLLIINAATKVERSIKLSAENIASRSIDVSGLESAQTYTAILFGGEDRKGVLTFTMKDINASISIEGTSDIFETIQEAIDAAKSGDIINVGSAKYDFGTTAVSVTDKALTIRAKDPNTIPEITSGGINFTGTVSDFKISGIKWIFKGSQSLVITALTSTINLTIENADFSGADAGFIYAASSASINADLRLTVNNTLIHDYGASGGDFIDFRAGTVTAMNFTNCTFWKSGRSFLRIDATTNCVGSSPFVFQNCTFDNLCTSGQRFVYIRTGNTTTLFNKCIITNLNNSSTNGSGATLTFTDTNISSGNVSTITSGSKNNTGITNVNPQYTSAATGNFTVGEASIKAAGLGDARWVK